MKDGCLKPGKIIVAKTNLKANAQSLLYSEASRRSDANRACAVTTKALHMARASHFHHLHNCHRGPQGDGERTPHPTPSSRELCAMSEVEILPPSQHRHNRSRKGEQCEKSSALTLFKAARIARVVEK